MSDTTAVGVKPMSGLFARAFQDIIANRVRLPSMPDVAVRIRAAMQSDNYSIRTIARVVQADASTAAYLVKVANSPIYRGVAAVKDVETGINRLGLKTTRNLVTAHALRAMFNTRSAALSRLLREYWRRSAKTAACASILAGLCPDFEPDRALLAGLLQDIGVLPLLRALERHKHSVKDLPRMRASLDAFCAKVSVVLLRNWEFDDDFVNVAGSRKDWLRDPQPKADLADLVLVARMHACVGEDSATPMPAIDSTPAFSKLPLGEVTVDAQLKILLKADADVRDLSRLLGV